MGGEAPRTLAIDGVADLVRRLDRLVEARPSGDPPLPIILCTGAAAERFGRGIAARLVRHDHSPIVPHVVVDGPAGEDLTDEADGDIALLDRIANELGRSMPPALGRLRLTSYWMLRDVLDAEIAPTRYDERRLALRDRLYARHQDLRPVARWLGQLADDPAPDRISVLLRPLTLHLPRFVFGWRLAHGRRVRWFGQTMSHVTGRSGDYLGAALCLVRNGPDRTNPALVRRMLLLSLLHDLAHATRRSLVSTHRRRRVMPFVLLFTHVEPDAAPARFLDTMAAVPDPSLRGTTLVVAALAPGADLPAAAGATVAVSLRQAAAVLDTVLDPARSSGTGDPGESEMSDGPGGSHGSGSTGGTRGTDVDGDIGTTAAHEGAGGSGTTGESGDLGGIGTAGGVDDCRGSSEVDGTAAARGTGRDGEPGESGDTRATGGSGGGGGSSESSEEGGGGQSGESGDPGGDGDTADARGTGRDGRSGDTGDTGETDGIGWVGDTRGGGGAGGGGGGLVGAANVVLVAVPEGPEDEAAAAWLAVHQRVRPPAPRLPRAVPLATLGAGTLAILLGLGGGASVLLDHDDRPAATAGPTSPPVRCPGIQPAASTAELVGVGDGTSSCSFFPNRTDATTRERELDEKHQAVERTIAQANTEVVERAGLDPYRTVVFFAPLTVPYGPERYGQTSLRQLRGIALAQEEANRRARNNQAEVPLRVVLANPGDRFAHGAEVARQIVELAHDDPTVVGVAGIAQSRASSRVAIGILGDAGLPVVAGPVTGDAMVDEVLSDSYYQVSPQNDRIAGSLADFATHVPIVGPAGGELRPADDAVIILDPNDEYSQNLADDFQQAFTASGNSDDGGNSGRHGTTRFPYSVDDGAASLDDIARRTCAALDNERDIVFFASRSQQLTGLLDNLADSDCADGVTMVAGSDITKFVQDPLVELGRYDFLRLYYASFGFASPDLAGDARLSRETTGFVEKYRERYPPRTPTFDIGDAALTYDAFWALQEAIGRAAGQPEPTGADVAESLASGVEFEGASGYVTFDRPGGGVGRVPRDKLLLVVEVHGRDRAIELLCGRLTEDTDIATWGDDDRPCRRDP